MKTGESENTWNVSRETRDRLSRYAALVRKWSPKINLVSRDSLKDLESRHIADSLQVAPYLNTHQGLWVDLGSGGGFPGLVTAILARESAPSLKTVLVESDNRKAVFLRTVIRELDLNASVVADRIENLETAGAEVLSARALAPLDVLLGYADRHLSKDGKALFFKGAEWKKEVTESQEKWHFHLEVCPSQTHEKAALLIIGDIARV